MADSSATTVPPEFARLRLLQAWARFYSPSSGEPPAELAALLRFDCRAFSASPSFSLRDLLPFCEVLREDKTLEQLDFSGRLLGDLGAAALADVIVHNRTIRHLNLSYNGLTERGIGAICDAAERSRTLQTLLLRGNYAGEAGAERLARLVRKNKSLMFLDVSANGLRVSGVHLITAALKWRAAQMYLNEDLQVVTPSVPAQDAAAARRIDESSDEDDDGAAGSTAARGPDTDKPVNELGDHHDGASGALAEGDGASAKPRSRAHSSSSASGSKTAAGGSASAERERVSLGAGGPAAALRMRQAAVTQPDSSTSMGMGWLWAGVDKLTVSNDAIIRATFERAFERDSRGRGSPSNATAAASRDGSRGGSAGSSRRGGDGSRSRDRKGEAAASAAVLAGTGSSVGAGGSHLDTSTGTGTFHVPHSELPYPRITVRISGNFVKEEIAAAAIHGTGLVAAVAATLPLLRAKQASTGLFVGTILYCVGVIALFASSTLNHSLFLTDSAQVFRLIDHSAVLLLIAGTYSPFLLGNLADQQPLSGTLLAAVWALAILGVLFFTFDIPLPFSVPPLRLPRVSLRCVRRAVCGRRMPGNSGRGGSAGAAAAIDGADTHWHTSDGHRDRDGLRRRHARGSGTGTGTGLTAGGSGSGAHTSGSGVSSSSGKQAAAYSLLEDTLDPPRQRALRVAVYAVAGWLGLVPFFTRYHCLPGNAWALLGIGGIVFSVGVLLYLRDTRLHPHQTALWYCLVLLASVMHWMAVYMYAGPPSPICAAPAPAPAAAQPCGPGLKCASG